jgi:hypothetical protein
VLPVKAFARQGFDDVGGNLLLYFDASADGEQKLDKNKIVRARPAQIRKCRIKSKIIRIELITRWKRSFGLAPAPTRAAPTASSTIFLNALVVGLRTVIVTIGILLTYPADEA